MAAIYPIHILALARNAIRKSNATEMNFIGSVKVYSQFLDGIWNDDIRNDLGVSSLSASVATPLAQCSQPRQSLCIHMRPIILDWQ